MYNFVFILGAQGSGKTTLAGLLKEKLNSVHIDYDWIRDLHLNKGWKNTSDAEGKMSFENLIFLLKNYAKHDYEAPRLKPWYLLATASQQKLFADARPPAADSRECIHPRISKACFQIKSWFSAFAIKI